jgi:hypothetical protein
VFAIITKEGNSEEFLLRGNNISRTVKFTLKKEKNVCIPFLDVQVSRQGERLIISVYRKKTDTGRYLHYESNHSRSVSKWEKRLVYLTGPNHIAVNWRKEEKNMRK